MSNFDSLLDRIQNGGEADQFEDLFAEIQKLYGLENIAYLGFNLNTRSTDPTILVTYPVEWTNRYREKSYQKIDPALIYGMRSILPIDWSSFARLSKTVIDFFGEAGELGAGNKGISIPVRGFNGDIGLISFSTYMKDAEWIEYKKSFMKDFQLIAANLHHKALYKFGEVRPSVVLTEREKDILYWAACGKTAAEVAMILDITHRGVRFHIKNILGKLRCINITHAVAKAVATELINVPR